jgi:hypothetical protein
MEEEDTIVPAINAFAAFDGCHFGDPLWANCGGSKSLEQYVMVGAFNHLHLDNLKSHLAELDWEEPENVRLIVCEQDEDGFSMWQLNRYLQWIRGNGAEEWGDDG